MKEARFIRYFEFKWTHLAIASILLISTMIVLLSSGVNANTSYNDKCLIIISGCDGYSPNELGKGHSFYDYINSTLQQENILFLTIENDQESDGEATVANVESAFDWLETQCSSQDDAIIYISDHEKRLFNETYFCFNDGNISAATINTWIDGLVCNSCTVILNGERSGLCGPELQDNNRDIICSMGADQEYDPDLFNITRSLEDPSLDLNHDGHVNFIEAYWGEVTRLQNLEQTPVLYDN